MRPLIMSIAAIYALSLSVCHADPTPTQTSAIKQASVQRQIAPAESAQPQKRQTDPTAFLMESPPAGTAYGEFRKLALDHGWKPKPDAQCMANVVGGDYKSWCPAHPEDVMCKVCSEVPELSSCSGDGHCLMQFTHEGVAKGLAVGTYGEITDWNAPADKSRLMVTGWEYNDPQTH